MCCRGCEAEEVGLGSVLLGVVCGSSEGPFCGRLWFGWL